MTSQNNEPAITNCVSLGLHRACIKNKATRLALVAAIVNATTTFHTPRSTSATRYVTIVNTTSVINMMAYVFIETIFSDMPPPSVRRTTAQQVQKRKQEYPDDVHKVPVQAPKLDR